MQITRTCDYGIQVLTQLALVPPGTRLTATVLARESHAPETFVTKILRRCAVAGLVVSHRGFEGGFELAREPCAVSMLDIVIALEGPLCLNECLPEGPRCESAAWLAAQDVWSKAQLALASVLAAATLDRLAAASTRDRPPAPMPSTMIPEPVADGQR